MSVDTDTGDCRLELRLGYGMQAITKVQLFFVPNEAGGYLIRGQGDKLLYRSFFDVLRRMKKRGKLASIPILAATETDGSEFGARLILNRSDSLAFRPSTKDVDAQAEKTTLLSFVDNKLDDIESMVMTQLQSASNVTIEQPKVNVPMTLDFGKNLRAVSKIALSFVAHAFGFKLAMTEPLRGLRNYVRHGVGANDEGSLWPHLPPEENMVADRYCKLMLGYFEKPTALALPDAHSVFLQHLRDRCVAVVELYGTAAFAVDLGTITPQVGLPVIHEFNYVRRTNRSVPLSEIAQSRPWIFSDA